MRSETQFRNTNVFKQGSDGLYRALSKNNSLCRHKHYLNLGYWRDNPDSLDQAGDALAKLMAEKAQLGRNHAVLDVGFGFGDQDLFWYQYYQPRQITGINSSKEQVEVAAHRMKELGLSETISLKHGEATNLSWMESSFDIVFSLEAAFHFKTREKFFDEAFRVLKPGGCLVLTDIVYSKAKIGSVIWFQQLLGRLFWKIPIENAYPVSLYREKLEKCGFQSVEVTSIWEDVYPRFIAFAKRRLHETDLITRINPLFRFLLLGSFRLRRRVSKQLMDYVLVSAIRPDVSVYARRQ